MVSVRFCGNKLFVTIFLGFLLVLTVNSCSAANNTGSNTALNGTTSLVSVSISGGQTDVDSETWSGASCVSDNGRYVVFASTAKSGTLVANFTNTGGWRQVYLRDTVKNITTLISKNSTGKEANYHCGLGSVISGDGRYIAYTSSATNLVGGLNYSIIEGSRFPHTASNVYVYYVLTGVTKCITLSWDNSTTANRGLSTEPDAGYVSMSDDGRYIAYSSGSTNLVENDTNGYCDTFLYDQLTGVTTLISRAFDGNQTNGESWYTSISDDGRYIVYASGANNIVVNDTNGYWDVFLYDTQSCITKRISVSSDGIEANMGSQRPFISGDGRYVVYFSKAYNLVNDTVTYTTLGGKTVGGHIYLYNILTYTTTIIDVNSEGEQGNYAAVGMNIGISDDGRYIAYESCATNLDPIVNNLKPSGFIYLYDRLIGTTKLISSIPDQTDQINGNYVPMWPTISGNGQCVVYIGNVFYTVSGVSDNNGQRDVYLYDMSRLQVCPGDDLQSIIDNAASGSWIILNDDNGSSYSVNLVVDKLLHFIGNGDVTLKALDPSSPVISLVDGADGTTITGLTITGATGSYGVNLNGVNNVTITNNTIIDNLEAFSIVNSFNNTIGGNIFDITPPTVTASVKGGTYNVGKGVSLSMSEDGTIYYTTDGSIPTTFSKKYTGPISISKNTTLKFIGVDEASNVSGVQSETYVIDTVKPVVDKIDPSNGATKVSAGKTIKVTFSEAIKAGSKVWVDLKNSSGKAIPFKYSISGKVLTIDPKSNLAESLYTLCIHSGAVTDLAGNPVAVKSSKFSVGTAPTVSKVDPKSGATKVAAGKTIKVTFNENIKKGSKFWVDLKNSSGKAVTFTSSISGKVLTIDPKSNLAESLYTLCIHSGAVTDLAGNPVALKSSKFSVGTAPTVSKVDPKSGATKVARSKTIKVTFNENIKAGSNYWIELKTSKGKSVKINKSISGKVLTIQHAKLAANTKYQLIIHTGAITDKAGNPFTLKIYTFTTGKT